MTSKNPPESPYVVLDENGHPVLLAVEEKGRVSFGWFVEIEDDTLVLASLELEGGEMRFFLKEGLTVRWVHVPEHGPEESLGFDLN